MHEYSVNRTSEWKVWEAECINGDLGAEYWKCGIQNNWLLYLSLKPEGKEKQQN